MHTCKGMALLGIDYYRKDLYQEKVRSVSYDHVNYRTAVAPSLSQKNPGPS